ncbi:MAG: ABC transporter permease [Actinomycetota bacterium]|nr:ABC transporter permease [Actinomycetota bacterium]
MTEAALATTIALFVVAAMRSATPLVLASIGGAFGQQINVFNVGLEAMMLTGAFTGFYVSDQTGSAVLGMTAGALAGLAVSLLMGVLVIDFGADEIVTGIALNLGALGLTAVLLNVVYGSDGAHQSTTAGLIKPIGAGPFTGVPFLGAFLNAVDVVMLGAVVLVVVAHIVTSRTRAGLRMRAIGSSRDAVESAGVDARGYIYSSFVVAGLLSGLAGAYLPLSGLSMFTVNMTAGAGFIALAAILFGTGMPLRVAFAAYLFGIATAVAYRVQNFGLPNEIVLMLPYVATLLALLWRAWRRRIAAARAPKLITA